MNTPAAESSPVKGKLGNQSKVYQILKLIGKPLTITEVSGHLPALSERTVRRAIGDLVKSGHIMQAGKDGAAVQYAIREYVPQTEKNATIVPLGGMALPIDEFIEMMASPEKNPLHKGNTKRPILSDGMSDAIRQRMTFVVMSAGEAGFNDAVSRYRSGLNDVEQELKYLLGVLHEFNTSAVWYDHYRDSMASSVREMHKKNPELFQLARDYIVNLTNKEG